VIIAEVVSHVSDVSSVGAEINSTEFDTRLRRAKKGSASASFGWPTRQPSRKWCSTPVKMFKKIPEHLRGS